MSVTVRDLLQLDLLSSAKIVAGEDGLDRPVRRVNFTDTPINESVDFDLLAEGDVFISSFYAGQNNADYLYRNIDFYIRTKSACCIALDEFVPHLPQPVLELANQNHYPIIHIKGTTPYAELIRSITFLILLDQDTKILENQIFRLINGTASPEEISQLYQGLVPNTMTQYVVVFISLNHLTPLQNKILREDLASQCSIRFLSYFNGGFFLLPEKHMAPLLEQAVRICSHYDQDYWLGYSEIGTGINSFQSVFRQALSANELAHSLAVRSMGYESLSVYKLLIPLQNSEILQKFCEETLGPLRAANLLETVRIYFNYDGNIEKTAEFLSQHKNTIRFRINKAKTLLGLERSHFAFIEKVSLAFKGERLSLLYTINSTTTT